MATTKNIGQILIDKAKELDPTYKPDKFNDMGEAAQIILDNMGSGEADAIELNLNDGSWETQTNSDGSIVYTKTCSEEESASLSVNNVRLTGTLSFGEGIDINTSTFGVFNLMHIYESINTWNQKTFPFILGNITVAITMLFNQLNVGFINKTEYNRKSLNVEFTPVKTTTEHFYQVYIRGSEYTANVNEIDSVQFRYPLGDTQWLVFPVIQKSGQDKIKNIVSTVYGNHIYEIHFSKDNLEYPASIDEYNKLIIRHMDGIVDNDAIGQDTISGSVELHGWTSFPD